MIDDMRLHDALRYSGLVPDVTFDAAGHEHRRKVQRVLEELGQTVDAQSAIDNLEEQVEQLEYELEAERKERREAQQETRDVESQYSAAREEISRLQRELDGRLSAQVSL